MNLRLFRLRFRRRLRKGQRQVEELGTQAEQGLERHFFRRFGHLLAVRRFVVSWLLLIIILGAGVVVQNFALSNDYQTLQPVPGGIYTEGVLGTFTNANPLYATSDVDNTISRLLFASLLTYNDKNQLVGDLASSYNVDSAGRTYTVHLKPHLTWQDGQPLTSADVVFTYQMIQDPDAESPLESSWQGITVTAPDPLTIVFQLPDPLASFPESLTNGIVPKHLLDTIPPADLRSADFNTVNPVGAGPFAWQAIQVTGNDPSVAQEQIALTPFAHYQGGTPKLREFVVRAYADQTQLVQAFTSGQLNGVEGLLSIPSSIAAMPSLQVHNFILSAATMVFFKTSTGVLADQQVRQALVQATNVPHIISGLGYPTLAVREPLLIGQLAYNPTLTQASFSLLTARQLLTADGWVSGPNGTRTKAGQPLTFTLAAADTPEYRYVTGQLQHEWQQLGVKLQVQLLDSTDFQAALDNHAYDAVLYGISIGVDPDVFVYWDSSQADIRSTDLNLSEWNNPTVDIALESGRTRLDPALRVIKYQPFLQAFQQQAPALGLYQPRLLYLTNGTIGGLTDQTINTAADRFDNVQNWEVREAKVTNN
jgi:peptide/nickel transport system substrate-binding protein